VRAAGQDHGLELGGGLLDLGLDRDQLTQLLGGDAAAGLAGDVAGGPRAGSGGVLPGAAFPPLSGMFRFGPATYRNQVGLAGGPLEHVPHGLDGR
jgi:hypothetical protein